MNDLDPRREGYKLVGEEIVTLSLENYRVTEKEYEDAKGKRLFRVGTIPARGYERYYGRYIFGSYDEFDPCFMKYYGEDTVELKKYIWQKEGIV